MKNKEYEDRVMLEKNEYLKLLNEFDVQNFVIQTNYYFDIPTRGLTSNHQVLRIREIYKGDIELTLKIKCDDCDLEINQTISSSEKNNFIENKEIPSKEISDRLLDVGINKQDLELIGSITTSRLEKKIDDYLLVLDENHYLEQTDYNLEIEANSREKAHDLLMNYCKKYNLTYKEKYLSKSRRAIQAFDELKRY